MRETAEIDVWDFFSCMAQGSVLSHTTVQKLPKRAILGS
jgi:hypothetical protein